MSLYRLINLRFLLLIANNHLFEFSSIYILLFYNYILQTYEALKSLYQDDEEKVELFIGGMLLSNAEERMTEVFRLILTEQIYRLREGNRYNLKRRVRFLISIKDKLIIGIICF